VDTRAGTVGIEAVLDRPVTRATGLSGAEVAARVARGESNADTERTSRTAGEIIRANVLTRFNAILSTMVAVIIAVAVYQRSWNVMIDAGFGLVLVFNSLIGIVQEVRAKRILDRLAVLNAPRVAVVRDGAALDIASDELVLDDLCILRTGDQVPADGIVRSSDGLEIDESLLTGESDALVKGVDDAVLSGSFVVAGSGRMQATAVGADSYARKLAAEVKQFKLARSELMDGINTILKFVQWAIIPIGLLVLWSQLNATDNNLGLSLRKMVGSVVGMVPEGLVLLTSVAFTVGAVILARRKVLVQELPAVEVLARVDVVCLDKTGTLTEGEIAFAALEAVAPNGQVPEAAEAALVALAYSGEPNGTALAVQHAFPGDAAWPATATVPFSSARKWSAAQFAGHGSWVLGAPEMVLDPGASAETVRAHGNALAETGNRTLVLAHTSAALAGEALPPDLAPVAFVMFTEKIRPDAAATMQYFTQQGVTLKVISGDSPRTVGVIARHVGVPGAERVMDARELPDDPAALAGVLEDYSVFGRVTPQQKRAMVSALQSRGHTVAMTGDGVNDALALKDADIGIAMGSGAPATRAVAQLVLMDGKFSVMPGVVAEGRRVIGNIERASNLFLTKTVYTMVIALFIVATRVLLAQAWEAPFLPRSFTLISWFTIGVPGLVLSLAPNPQRYVPGFIRRVLRFAIPAGVIAGGAAAVAYGVGRNADLALSQSQTMGLIALLGCALWVLGIVARPYNWWRILLVAVMAGCATAVLVIVPLADLFLIDLPPAAQLGETAIVVAIACAAIEIIHQWVKRYTAAELRAHGHPAR